MIGKGSLAHNRREFFAENVEPDRVQLNICYQNENLKEVYKELFDDAMRRYNIGKRKDRQITNYYEKIRQGKQEKLFHEVIFQIGNREDMAVGTAEGDLAVKVLDEYIKDFQKRNPTLRVFGCYLHQDEATPHLHIDFIPYVTDWKGKGMDTRVSLKQALKSLGFQGGNKHDTELNQWMNHEKEVLAEIAKQQWTLKDCIDYAIQNNISLQKTRLQMLSTKEDVKQAQAELLPSLSFSTSQNVNYNPWPETNRATVTNGYVETSVDKVYYNGSYGLNLNWTVWNGNRNRNQLKLDKITAEQAELDSATTANSIQEQIAQLYVQILYSADAVDVCKQSLETSSVNEARGKEFVNVGKMSKADLAQLTAQRAKDEYSLVEAESNLKNYKRQMKQLLQITSEEEFDVAMPTSTDEMAMETIPTLTSVYTAALDSRPEIKNAQLGIDGSELSIKMAKAQRMPTIGLNASAMTNTTSMSSKEWGTQLKNNFSTGAGVTLSIPIFDNRQSKTAIRKAKIQQQQYQLDLQDKQTTLYSTIENYWLQATTNQSKYRAAKANTTSAQESYDLLSEQFRLGLKNTVELMTGKTNLLTAQQNELQSKYLTILNMNMLDFYKGKKVKE